VLAGVPSCMRQAVLCMISCSIPTPAMTLGGPGAPVCSTARCRAAAAGIAPAGQKLHRKEG